LALQRGRGFCSRVAGGTVGYIQTKQGTEGTGRGEGKRGQNPLQSIEKKITSRNRDGSGKSAAGKRGELK